MQVERPAVLEVLEDSERVDVFDGTSSHVIHQVQQWYDGLQTCSDFMVRLPRPCGVQDWHLETGALQCQDLSTGCGDT